MGWNLKKIEINLSSIIEEKTKEFIFKNIKNFRQEFEVIIKENNGDCIRIKLIYLTVNNETTNFKNKVRLTCKLWANDAVEVNMKDIAKYEQLYGTLVLKNDKTKTSYFIVFKPEIKHSDSVDFIYSKILNIYHSTPQHNINAVLDCSNFKNLKDKLYIALVLFTTRFSKIDLDKKIIDKLYSLLSYYGYDNLNYKPVKNIFENENTKEFTDLLYLYIYNILFNEDIELFTNEEYEYYSKKIIKKYKELI